jgi:hypothetical protein
VAPGVRHRGDSRETRAGEMDGVRRLVGFHARPRLCAEASRALHGAGAARHLPAAPVGARLVLPEGRRRGVAVPGSLGGFPEAPVGRGAQGLRRVLLPAAHERQPRDAARSRARVVDLGKRAVVHEAEQGLREARRRSEVRRRVRTHRVPLLHQQGMAVDGQPAHRRRAEDPPHPGRHRPGPVRRGVPGHQRLGPAQGVARGGPADRAGRRSLGVRTRHRAGARAGLRSVRQTQDAWRQTFVCRHSNPQLTGCRPFPGRPGTPGHGRRYPRRFGRRRRNGAHRRRSGPM